MNRYIFLDFQDGNGWIDISAYVKYDTLTINFNAFNDTFKSAQKTASFSVIYDASLYPKIIGATTEILIRIFDNNTDSHLVTEFEWADLLTEDGYLLALESGDIFPIYSGFIPLSKAWSYNGIQDNTIIQLDAQDFTDWLNTPVGDVMYENFYIMNSVDQAHSLVHALAAIAGFTPASISAVDILDVLPVFAPDSEDSLVFSVLDTMLYEFGYVLNFNARGQIQPLKWLVDETTPIRYAFTEENCISKVDVKESVTQQDAVHVVSYDIGFAENILVYRDNNCGYNADGSFAGYNLIASQIYPYEANVIDPVTGLPTVVYQQYTDEGIKYKTNRAIAEGLDYYYKAFESNFTSLIATKNHIQQNRYSVGIVVYEPPVFLNTKCKLMYYNPTTDSSLKLYFNNVFADVYYRKSKRDTIINIATDPIHTFTYTASYLYTAAYADTLAKALASRITTHNRIYTLRSEDMCEEGSTTSVVLDDGTSIMGLIMNRVWDERTQIYKYTILEMFNGIIAVTQHNFTETAAVDPTYTYGYQNTVGTPEAIIASSPSYLGIGELAGINTADFTGAIVDSVGTIVVGSSVSPTIGSWMVNYLATYVPLGMYVWDGIEWIITTNVEYISSAAIDLCNLQVGGITISGFTTFITAIVKTLFAQNIVLLSGGNIKDAGYTAGVSGFKIASDGTMEINNVNARGTFTNGERYDFNGNSVDQREDGVYIGNGTEQYTSLSPYYGDNNISKWHPTGILATYTGDTYASEYVRAATIPNSGGYFIVTTSASTMILYRYLLDVVTKIATATLPTAGTDYSSFDIVSVTGNFVEGVYVSILNNSVIRKYSLSLAGAMTLVSSITFPVNVSSVISCTASPTSGYSNLYVVDILAGTFPTYTNAMRLYGYKTSDSSLTLLHTLSHPTGYDSGWQNQLLQTNYFLDGGVSKSESAVLLNNFIVKVDAFTQVMSLAYYNNIFGNRCARCSIYGNAIFHFDTINDNTSITVWRGSSQTRLDSEEFRGLSTNTVDTPHRAIPLGYGLMACIGTNFGGIKVLAVAPNL